MKNLVLIKSVLLILMVSGMLISCKKDTASVAPGGHWVGELVFDNQAKPNQALGIAFKPDHTCTWDNSPNPVKGTWSLNGKDLKIVFVDDFSGVAIEFDTVFEQQTSQLNGPWLNTFLPDIKGTWYANKQ